MTAIVADKKPTPPSYLCALPDTKARQAGVTTRP
jgi:hypothetical protein